MANKGKRETKKQITEVKQELQKELDKMGRVHSNIPTQQVEESGTTRRKSTVQPTPNTSLTGGKIPSNIIDNDNRKSSTTSIGKGNQVTQQKSKPKSSTSIKVPSMKEDEDEEKKKGRPKGAKDKQPRKRKPKENNGTTEKRKGNYKGRPKGAKDKQPRKPKTMIEEAQEKLEQRREELARVSQNTEGFEDDIYLYDEEKRMKFQTSTEYGEAFYIGEQIEQQIYEMCAEAKMISIVYHNRTYYIEDLIKSSKEKYGAKTYYNNLWNKQGQILESCQIIIYSSDEGQVSIHKAYLRTMLLDIPYDEIEVED